MEAWMSHMDTSDAGRLELWEKKKKQKANQTGLEREQMTIMKMVWLGRLPASQAQPNAQKVINQAGCDTGGLMNQDLSKDGYQDEH